MKIGTYNYILNTLLRVAPFFAGTVLDEAIKKSGHTIDSISAGEMLKALKADVVPKLSKEKEYLTDSLILANTSTIQTDDENKIISIEGPFKSTLEDDPSFVNLASLGFLCRIKDCYTTTVRELELDGNIFRVTISPIYNHSKSIIGTLSSISNLTLQREIEEEILTYSENLRKEIEARVEAEEELKENQTLLFHSAKLVSLGEMASGIAHEINNPLASIKLSVNLLNKLIERNKLTEEKILEETKSQLELIDRISNTIMSMKKLSRPAESDDFNHVSVKQVVKDVLALSGEKFSINDVELRVNFDCEDVIVYSQETQLGQVLINLVNNSFEEIYDQYNNPWIEIAWTSSAEFNYITVTDCGPGIAEENVDKIFAPFFTGKMNRGGTGLGLSISSQILKAHNGHLYVDKNCPNTKFIISLPKMKE